MIAAWRDHNVEFSITIKRTKTVVETIDGIDDSAWVRLDYDPQPGIAEVAATDYKDMH